MTYTKITISTTKKHDHATVSFEGTYTSVAGAHECSGILVWVYLIDHYYVIVSPLNQRPIGVCKGDPRYLEDWIQQKFQVKPEFVR